MMEKHSEIMEEEYNNKKDLCGSDHEINCYYRNVCLLFIIFIGCW